jgi:arginase
MNINKILENKMAGKAVAVVGVPYDDNSSFMKGPAKAPPKIREAFNSDATNKCTESGLDLAKQTHFFDVGDLELKKGLNISGYIEHIYQKLLDNQVRVLSLGGDHAVTLPIIQAYEKYFPDLNILHFDAHPDLYDEFEGNRYSHACPFARIMEEGLIKKLVQVGIRTMTPHQQEQADRFKVTVIDMKSWPKGLSKLRFTGPVYISLDLDVLDPAYAPGVSHLEPGGLRTRDVITLIQQIKAPIVGADIVEYNPLRDINGMTAMVAAKLLKELADKMLTTGNF